MITPMKKVLIAGRATDRDKVLCALRDEGIVHVEPVYPELVAAPPNLQKQIDQAAKAIDSVAKLKPIPEKDSSLKVSPADLVEQVNGLTEERARLQSELMDLKKQPDSVAPWGRIHREDLDGLRRAGLAVEFFICPDGLQDLIEAELIHIVTKQSGLVYLLAISRQPIPSTAAATRILQPQKDRFQLEQEQANLTAELDHIEDALRALAARRDAMKAFHAELEQNKRFAEVELSLMSEGSVFVLKGWLPASAAFSLESNFAGKGLSIGIKFSDPDTDELPPTKLQNPWWCRPIQVLYKVLGITPGYHEVDISPFFLPFLTIFTAMLFADAGYGLVALAALLLAYKPATARGVPKDLLQLFLVLFAGVVSYGLMTNTYFGETLIKLTSFDSMSPDGEAFLKKCCFFLGALHISIAHLWKIRRAPIGLASLAELGWVLFVWAMFALVNVLVLGETQPPWMIPLFGVSLGLVLVFTSPSWNPVTALSRGLGSIALSAAAFLSDIISYIRLWAVGLAGGILAASFNELAGPLPLFFAVVILVAAHFMNIALCMVAVFAHGVRLNLLEFSNHVGMEWSGREYEPFRKN
ncbi:V-type ATP synthase subunit I [Desulfoferrobacter suflitae]|uniref:V-type ATP synthase subunit I n=1 Tax=Desulfoferrobacter suflitae TaxID=2865782 RepID=UPI00216430E8|nr:hypothetical protein [Desulfoferrobacter suflitae]MCK8604122.1 hypothetical protein [Desulfoferrobacter suflitae]